MRLLLVDDNDQLRTSLRRILERAGLVVAGEAKDGNEAVRFLKTGPVDAVVMDVRMPGMDGVTAVRLMQRDHPETPVVAFSSDPRAEQPMLDGGAVAFVTKGSPADELVAVLRSLDKVGQLNS